MHDLGPLLSPRSVAVVGASSNLDSLAGRPIRNLRAAGLDIDVYPVNPARAQIGGYECYPEPAALPVAPDVAVVVTPGPAVLPAIEALAVRGTRAAIVISAGFGELGEEGRLAQQRMAEVAAAHGMILLGPNTLGVHDYARGLALSFVWYGRRPVSAEGSLAVVTQSGSGMTSLCDQLVDAGLPLGVGLATGNEAGLTVVDAIEYLAEQDSVRVIATSFEQLREGPRFLSVAARLRELGKPLIALKVGRTESGSAAVLSHTGALAGSYPTMRALMRQHGVMEIADVDEFGPTAAAALTRKFPAGRRIAVITSSGGAGAIAADRADELGMDLPPLSVETQNYVRTMMPGFAASNEIINPIDLTAQSMDRPHALEEIAEHLLGEPYIDAVIHAVPSSGGPHQAAERGRRLAEVAHRSSKPLISVILTGTEGQEMRNELVHAGVPTFASPSRAVEVIERLERFAHVDAAPPVAFDRHRAAADVPHWAKGGAAEFDTLQWLGGHGLPVINQRLAATAEEAAMAASELGFPVAVKVSSPDIAHKTEAGGVLLGVRSAEDAVRAFGTVTGRARAVAPKARIDGVTVSPMVESSTELVAGVTWDAVFGPVLMLGLGGIWAEILGDVALRSVPISSGHVAEMVDELRGAPVLRGARGTSSVKDGALEDLMLALSELAMVFGPRLQSLDLNPVAVARDGDLLVLDAAVYFAQPDNQEASR